MNADLIFTGIDFYNRFHNDAKQFCYCGEMNVSQWLPGNKTKEKSIYIPEI